MDALRLIERTAAAIVPPDAAAADAARRLQDDLTKPPGALGRLEELAVWAASVRGERAPEASRAVIVVAAADHGVAAEAVSAYPPDVTAQMLANFLRGGAAINVLARAGGIDLHIVDAGVATQQAASPDLHVAAEFRGSANIARGPAMTRDAAATLVARGIELARAECTAGATIVGLGDMGIGNTTVAAALTSACTGAAPRLTAGRGTGIDDAGFAAKVRVIEQALALHAPEHLDALGLLAALGGGEMAFLAGVALGAAAERAMVVLDGYPTTAAALVAARIAPELPARLLASHRSAEPGHAIALEALGLRPLLDFDMRLGEGTGAALAIPILRAAMRLPREMATFSSAGVSRAAEGTRVEA